MLFLREGCCSTLRCAALAEPFVPTSKYVFSEHERSMSREARITRVIKRNKGEIEWRAKKS